MDTTLTIDFVGMYGFVTHYLAGSDSPVVDVLMPNTSMALTSRRTDCTRCNGGSKMPPHEPRLLLDYANLAEPIKAQSNFDRQIPAPGRNWMSASLANRRLIIAGVKGEDLVIRRSKAAPGKPCPNYDTDDIAWLAEMSLACGNGAASTEAFEDSKKVIARVELRKGSLFSASLACGAKGNVIRYRFPPVYGKTYDQVFADSVRYTVNTQNAALSLQPLNRKAEAPTIKLQGSVHAAISHLPLDPSDNDVDHFHHLYALAVDGVPHNIPRESDNTCDAPSGAGLRWPPRICIGGMFFYPAAPAEKSGVPSQRQRPAATTGRNYSRARAGRTRRAKDALDSARPNVSSRLPSARSARRRAR
jgi:hypothetical protein